MTTSSTPSRPTGFWPGLGRFLRGTLRLLLFALVVALVTGGLYLGLPYLYRAMILPVQNNRVVIDHVQRTQTQLQKDFIQQSAAQQQRLAQLEADLATERESRSELESRLAAQTETVAAQATAQADLAARLAEQSQSLAALSENLETLSGDVTGVEDRLATPDDALSQVRQQTLLLQLGQAVLIARLHLVENNAGQAQTALAEVGPSLDQLAELSGDPSEAVSELQDQLERVETAIEERPFTTLQELDILAQLLQAFPQR